MPDGAVSLADGLTGVTAQWLHDFAHAVAAKEREACAIAAWSAGMDEHNKALGMPCDARDVGSAAARSIRMRSNVEFSGVPAKHSSNHPAGGTSAGTQG